MNGVYYVSETKTRKTLRVDFSALSVEHKKIYEEAENYISNKYPIKCVCGRLCTGLHERTCQKFRNAVNREFIRRTK